MQPKMSYVCSSSEGLFGFPPGFLGILHIIKTYLHTWLPNDMIFKKGEREKSDSLITKKLAMPAANQA